MGVPKPHIVESFGVAKHLIEFYPEGVVVIRINGPITISDLTEGRVLIGEQGRHRRFSLLMDLSNLDHIDMQALASGPRIPYVSVAVLVGGFGQRSLYSMVPRLFGEKPKQPTQFFMDEGEAWKWLREQHLP